MPHDEVDQVIDVTVLVDPTIVDQLPQSPSLPLRHPPRGLLLVCIVAAALGLLVSSIPVGPGTPGNARLVAIDGALTGMGTNAIYSVAPGGILNAYKISSGRRLWRHKLPSQTALFCTETRNNVFFYAAQEPAGLIALDTRTGAERWRRPGMPNLLSIKRSLAFYDPNRSSVHLVSPSTGAEIDPEPTRGTTGLIAVSLDTGQVVREYPNPGDGTHDLVFAQGVDGNTVTNVGFLSRHFRDGAKFLDLARQEFRAFPGKPDYTWVTVVNDLLIAGDGTTMVGYDRQTLHQRWSGTDPGINETSATYCGRWICLSGKNQNAGYSSTALTIVAIDAATGALQWQTRSRFVTGGSGAHVLATPQDLDGSTSPAVISSKNGAVVTVLRGWQVLDSRPDGQRFSLIRLAPAGGFRLGVIDLQQPKRVRIIAADVSSKTCQSNQTFIACRLKSGATGLWRYA